MNYPFLPKSNMKIRIGEYWNIPLSNGDNAFFMFLDVSEEDRRFVYIGMLDYSSREPTLSNDMEYKLIWQANAHIKTIKECGGLVRGILKPIKPQLHLDSAGGHYCNVVQGYTVIRSASKQDVKKLRVSGTCGYMVPKTMAEKQWVNS